MSPSDRVRLVSNTLTSLCTSKAALGGTNSCGVVHVISSAVVHDNSSGANAHGNSCDTHGGEVLGVQQSH